MCFVFCVAYEYSWQYVGYLVFSFGVVVVVVCACFWQYAIGDVLAMLSDHQERFVWDGFTLVYASLTLYEDVERTIGDSKRKWEKIVGMAWVKQ